MNPYDDPYLRPKDFLYAVMRDRSADIRDRVRAATALMAIEPNGPPRIPPPSLTIRIQLPHALEMQRLFEIFQPGASERPHVSQALLRPRDGTPIRYR